MEKKTNPMSVIALILAIIGFFSFGGTSLIALILAIIAKKNDAEDKLAKAAFIISIITLVGGIVFGIACVACGGIIAATGGATTYLALLA